MQNSSTLSRIPLSRSLSREFGRYPMYFLAPDDGASNAGGDNNQSSNSNQSNNSQSQNNQSNQPNIADAVKSAIADILGAKGGDKDAALETLIKRNHKLETALETARSSGISEADKATLAAAQSTLQAFGVKSFDELKARIESGDAAIGERDGMKREGAMRVAVEAAGIDYADFSTRKGVDDWAYEVKDENRDGKTIKVPYVTIEVDGKSVTKPLSEHAQSTFPTLARAGAQSNGNGQSTSGGRFAKQGVAGTQATVWDSIREAKTARQESVTKPAAWTQQLGLSD